MTGATATGWHLLEMELDAWAAAGREARLWWRDDDAGAASPALERLLELATASEASLALAVIPERTEDSLVRLLDGRPAAIAVLQHGFAHGDHAAPGQKKCELVSPAVRAAVTTELRRGRETLVERFGARFRPVLVPPWNRIAPDLVAQLPALGFAGLSTYGPRTAARPAPGMVQVNCHLDLVQWRPERRFLGRDAAIALLADQLAAQRRGGIDAEEPCGILTHHQVHDAAAWDFLATLLARLARHPAARLLPAAEVFAALPGGETARAAP